MLRAICRLCFTLAAGFCLTGGMLSTARAQERLINSFEAGSDFTCVQAIDGQVAGNAAHATQGTASLKVTLPISQWYPGVRLLAAASTVWNFKASGGLAFDMTNPEAAPLAFGIRLEDVNGNAASYDTTIEANHQVSFRMPFSAALPNPADYGVRALPNPFANLRPLPIVVPNGFDLTRVVHIIFYVRKPPVAHTFYLDNVRLLAPFSADALLAKSADAYGQFDKSDWPGKLHGDSDFALRRQQESSDLAAHPPASILDKWGGWKNAPAGSRPGFFRTAKINNRWWLITPDGNPFFSVGMDATTLNDDYGATLTTGREGMFNWLPGANDYLGSHWGFTTKIFTGSVPQGYTYNFLAANVERKFGPTWDTDWQNNVLTRLLSWGFNTLGNWSDSRLAGSQRMPYLAYGSTQGDVAHVSSGNDVWGPLPDPFDARFPALITANLTYLCAQIKNDPWCIGYCIDNELSWTGKGLYANYGLAYGALSLNALTSPAKAAFSQQMQARYTTITALNNAWGTSFADWNAFDLPFAVSATPSVALQFDMSRFVSTFAQKYYSTVRAQLKALDPNHLYLGSRFLPYTPEVVQAAASSCDVLSFNIYAYTVDSTQWYFLRAYNKPCLVTEFHIGAYDRGLFGASPIFAPDQTTRAAMYQAYVQSVADNAMFVGCHWYEYGDEPLLGRAWDGENYNIGFVDVTDTPYPEMVAGARAIHGTVYTRHANAP